jgi:chromosome segregation protein
MRLKTLDIVGFKSFVDRTIVQFEEGVTGVVGPNGCGKSNLVDAIRWVMGEQSAKHLRGSAMEDVIFSGSESRAATGMSQVFLTFDNSDGLAPAEYAGLSEIQVGRRLYRSGESEYFINKASCRLKDIVDFFLDTGVGSKAYSIVEQGMVGQVIAAKPFDRRVLIEEAAGISKFKARKEAALRKIESTQANLLRLTDILNELSRQINSLNRQAKKAERYQRIASELKELEIRLGVNRRRALLKELETHENDNRLRNETEVSLSAELSRYEADIESQRLSLTELERQLEKVQQELYAVHQSIKLNEAATQHNAKDIETLVARSLLIEQELKGLRDRCKLLSERIIKINQEKVEADCSLVSLTQATASLEEEVNRLREERTRSSEDAEGRKRQIVSDTAGVSEFKTKIDHLDRRLVEVTGRIAKDQSEIDSIDRRRDQVVLQIKEGEQCFVASQELRSKLNMEVAAKRDALMQAREELSGAEQDVNELKDAQNAAHSRLESIEEMRKNLEGYREGVKNVILKSQEATESLRGVLGTVGEVMETDCTYEMALSAVLGERLQFVVVKSHDEGVEAIDYLKTASRGRSSFIPLAVRVNEELSPPQGDGIIGPLAQYVRFTDDYKQIVRYLLSDVILVEDIRKAIHHWETNGSPHTFVTLAGEVLDPSGVITGGIGGDADAGLVAQRRRIRELKEEISARQTMQDKSEEKLRTCHDSVKVLEEEIEKQDRDIHNLEIKLVGDERDLGGLKDELTRLDGEHDRLVVEIATLNEEKHEVEHERASSLLRLEQLSNDQRQTQESLNEITNVLGALMEDLASREKRLVDLKVSLAQAEERQASISREIEQLILSKAELVLDIGKREDELSSGGQRVVVLRRETDEHKAALDVALRTVEKLTLSQTGLQERYQQATEEIRSRELAVRELRQRRETALTAAHEVALKLTELREKIRYLEEGIRERYRVELSTIVHESLPEAFDADTEEQGIAVLKEKLEQMGSVNADAIKEYEELSERCEFMSKQHTDLTTSIETLKQAISKINRISRQRFKKAFDDVDTRFQELFPKLFQGGRARLMLTDEENLLESGVEIVAQPPGKRLQSISLLSGGEKALTAVAFIFSIFLTKPSPFCLLDEVDAPLDDANVDRFNNLIRSMTPHSQFVLITHNKRTMELADVLYGVTMEEPGVSKMVSVRLNQEAQEPEAAVA